MAKRLDLHGMTFSRLKVVACVGPDERGAINWLCSCSCGGSRAVRGADLKRGMVGSCGCAISDLLVKRNTTHGGSKTRLYRIWQAVKDRTGNPRASRYDYYGGRGISLCPEWNEFRVFREWALTNGYSDELSIDRRDNNGNYQPDNCRWVNQEVQVRNRRPREEWPLVKGKANGLSE